MASSSSTPAPLERFPAHVQEAYRKFMAGHRPADLQIVVDAALRDFMPKGRAVPEDKMIPSDLRLIENLGFDSLAVAEIVFFFEDLFQVSIPTQEIVALQTVGDLHEFVTRKLAAQAGAQTGSSAA